MSKTQILASCVALAAMIMVSGCGKFGRIEANFTGTSISCIEGVKYIQFSSGATVQYDQEGKVVKCK